MENEKYETIDICHECEEERIGNYTGDYDNPIFLCLECEKDIITYDKELKSINYYE